MKIIFATNNEGKLKEVKAILSEHEVIGLKEAGIDIDIVEDGDTFEENAMIKAKAIMKMTNKIVLADDSGLEIDYLDKKPGVHSARFLGADTPYIIKNRKILNILGDVPKEKRTARFVAAIAAAFPDGREFVTRGVVEGEIGLEIKGTGGFGYDPIFYLPEYEMTIAQLSSDEKNKISHRAKGLEKMKIILNEEIGG